MHHEMGGFTNRNESAHYLLYDFAKTALISIFASPYTTVCDLYCGGGSDLTKWNEAQIGHYIGIDASSSGICEAREAWESQRKPYTTSFCELDPCMDNLGSCLQDKGIPTDIVCCLQHLQLCFENEGRARSLLLNVSSLLKPGGYFFGVTPDSSTIWSKYQKNIEASHNKGGSMKPIVPNCIRSENYVITFETEEEKFPLFGKKYQLKFTGDVSPETHCLVHFPSLIRLAREVGLEYVEIQNLTEFYDDNRVQFAGLLCNGGNFVDPRGKLQARSFDILGLYTTFIFQKPDPCLLPPICTPISQDGSHMQIESSDHCVDSSLDSRAVSQAVHHGSKLPQYRDDGGAVYSAKERERHTGGWRHQTSATADERIGHGESGGAIGKDMMLIDRESQVGSRSKKGILGAGPQDLRFADPL